MIRRTLRTVPVVAVALLLAPLARAAAPQFWRLEGTAAFLKGEIENLSLDSEARLRLGPAVRPGFDPAAPNAWCVARGENGVLYVGTGNDGRVFRVDGEEGRVLFDAEQLQVHAVAVGPDARVYAATSPDGAVYAIDADGEARTFFDPEERYVWDLAFDEAANLIVATGDEGRVYRVQPDGTSEPLLTSADTHVLSLALDDAGRVYAGSSPAGVVYRIDRQGKVFVVLDSPFREIKALTVGEAGGLYVAAIDGAAPAPPPTPATAPPAPGAGAPVAEVTVTETFTVAAPPAAPPPSLGAPATGSPAGAPPRGAVLRIDPDGTVETLWTSTEDVPHALAGAEAGVLVGTGDKGKVYRVNRDGSWALVASLQAKQVTAIAAQDGPHAPALVTSNPARVVHLSPATGPEGTFVTDVWDAAEVSAWGRVRWEGRAPADTEVRLETRSGNTSTPDPTWSDWLGVEAAPRSAEADRVGAEGSSRSAAVRSESARFLQVRLTLVGRDQVTPEIEALSVAYLQRNLRPRVTSITVHPAGHVFQKPLAVTVEPEVLGLDPHPHDEGRRGRGAQSAPPMGPFGRVLQRKGLRTFVWEAEDPNRDVLVYRVEYRALGDERWRPLRSGLTEPVLAWDTTAMADGRYLLRVTASDAPDNPRSLALSGHRDSVSFEVDNAPPDLTAALLPGDGTRIRAVARDAGSRIRRLEYSVDAGRWQEVYPLDGINDSSEEVYVFAVDPTNGAGAQVVVLRVFDRLGNVATGRVDVP